MKRICSQDEITQVLQALNEDHDSFSDRQLEELIHQDNARYGEAVRDFARFRLDVRLENRLAIIKRHQRLDRLARRMNNVTDSLPCLVDDVGVSPRLI
jgi:hypothetical protein